MNLLAGVLRQATGRHAEDFAVLDLVVVTTAGNDYNEKHMAVVPLVAELVRSVSARPELN
ncbi:MAG: hypothetical protein WBP17_14015 [Gemmatimonadota bacterium]